MQILLLSDNNYLLGLLKGYCINVGCDIKAINNCYTFYNTIHNNPPLLIFIDMDQLAQLSGMAEWHLTQKFIKENNIILCGFGKQSPDDRDTQSNLTLKKIFSDPFNEDEILFFLKEILLRNEFLKKERRQGDRRNRADRRQFSKQMHASSPSDEQQNLEENIKLGALTINPSHKTITINDIPIILSHKEFQIIDYFVKNPGCVAKTEDIIKNIWANCSTATKADVHQYMHLLRKKIETDPHHPKLLITIKGVGYELCP